jgi:protein SCO1
VTRRPRLLFVAAVLALGGLLAACTSSPGAGPQAASPADLNEQVNNSGTYQGIGLTPAQPRPSFTLTDTAGAPFAFGQRTAGHPTLLYFGYTQCPDVCPTTMADIHNALATLPVALQKTMYVVFVTTDVKADTAVVLATWLRTFSTGLGATFVGLRGTQAEIDTAQAAAHIMLAEDAGQTHSAKVLLFGADDYARVAYLQGTTEAQQLAHDLPLVARS